LLFKVHPQTKSRDRYVEMMSGDRVFLASLNIRCTSPLSTNLKLVKVNPRFLRHGINPFRFEGFNRLRRNMEFHPPIALCPPNAFPLQIGVLQTLSPAMGVGYRKGIIGFFSGELTATRHLKPLES
jgi:hypothetical protein